MESTTIASENPEPTTMDTNQAISVSPVLETSELDHGNKPEIHKECPDPKIPADTTDASHVHQTPTKTEDIKLTKLKFDRDVELDFFKMIKKAPVIARNGISQDDPNLEKDIAQLAEMVTNMTQFLAASHSGQDTTVRALAYMKSSNEVGARDALRQAKNDRKGKPGFRTTSGHSRWNRKSSGTADTKPAPGQEHSSDVAEVGATNLSNGEDVKKNSHTQTEHGIAKSDVAAAATEIKEEAQGDENHVKGEHVESDGTKQRGPKKFYQRRKWWNSGKKRQGKVTPAINASHETKSDIAPAVSIKQGQENKNEEVILKNVDGENEQADSTTEPLSSATNGVDTTKND